MGNLTERSPPAFFGLLEGQHFLLGHLMRSDGAGFLKLDGVSVALVALGSGATLDAERRGRFFYMTSGNLTLTNLRIVNGMAQVRQSACHARQQWLIAPQIVSVTSQIVSFTSQIVISPYLLLSLQRGSSSCCAVLAARVASFVRPRPLFA